MDNKKILEILNNPAKYIGEPIWVDMIFSVKRLMEQEKASKNVIKESINRSFGMKKMINDYQEGIKNRV